jgi:hypothetical protein
MKNKLVDMYVDNLRSKKLTKNDTKLFEVTGFSKLVGIMKKVTA